MNEVNNSEFERSEDYTIRIMADRKGFIPVILIAVLALVIAVGGVGIGLAWRTGKLDKIVPPNIREMFGRGEKPEEGGKEPEEAVEDETADWEIYRNEEYKYEVKYPLDCSVEAKEPPLTSPGVDFHGNDLVSEVKICDIVVRVYLNPKGLSVNRWLDLFRDELSPTEVDLAPREPISIAGTQGVKGFRGCCTTYHKGISLPKEGKIYEVDLLIWEDLVGDIFGEDGLTEEAENRYEQTLSTFKFIR